MSGNNKEWNYLDLGCLTVNVCGGIYFSSSELQVFHRFKSTDIATVIYTSGVTGTPKAVQLTYKAVNSCTLSAKSIAKNNETHPDFDIEDHYYTYLCVLPLRSR